MQPFTYDHLSPAEAVEEQKALLTRRRLTPLAGPVRTIGGADISFNKYSETVYAGIIVLSFPELQVLHSAAVVTRVKFPYVPGLLAFREVPPIMEAWHQLEVKPDVLVLDGHGTAHPRGMGVATHFGIVCGTPAIGSAKSLLTGKYGPLEDVPGATADLLLRGEKIGEVLRTKKGCNPVYVSPGYGITQEESTAIIKQCVGKYRIPEPTRMAHLLVNAVRVEAGAKSAS